MTDRHVQDQLEEQFGTAEANFEDLLRESVNNAGFNNRKKTSENNESDNSWIDVDLQSMTHETETNGEHKESAGVEENEKAKTSVNEREIVIETNRQNHVQPNELDERTPHGRPHCVSVIGAILRLMGDEQNCRACGKHLRLMGDEIYCVYAARRLIPPLLLELSTSDMYY